VIARIKLLYSQLNWLRTIVVMSLAALLIFSACTKPNQPLPDVAKKDLGLIESLPDKALTFNDIKPVLESRCIVCHGCYDAPCQLKLSSYEGITRGANELKVYDKGRFTYQQPTRLFIDADSTERWREMNFFSVLNDGEGQSVEENLKNSLLYQMLNLKQRNPLPESGKLPRKPGEPEYLDISLDRKQVCTGLDTFGDFAKDHPLWGMPYAVPNLSDEEYGLLVQWLAQGAKASEKAQPSPKTKEQIKKWEAFFNGRSNNKEKLVSRYIYEHLVLGHLHFKGAPEQEFFRLVRSRTESGNIDEIATVRPYDDPQGDFYYRLRPYTASIVDKSHIVYELSDARMQRYRDLFLQPTYEVAELPGYNPAESSNYFINLYIRVKKLFGLYEKHLLTPFEVFGEIPAESRYQFLLDDARFFINGFIKGPVCRGLGALSSIEDHFWVFFLKPENPSGYTQHGLDQGFLKDNDNLLHLPTELANTDRILNAWIKYWPKEQEYMQKKLNYYQKLDKEKQLFPIDINKALDQFVWNGIGSNGTTNSNAALTVFRHLDSASVHYGLLGDEPETAWMIDYPVFERLHYLLVAGYNTFGTLGHQASARLYMDFLRTESEDNFLFFLPVETRKYLFKDWHGVDRSSTRKQNIKTSAWLKTDSVTGYTMKNEQHEFFNLLRAHIAAKSPDSADLNRCSGEACFVSSSDLAMQSLANLNWKSSEFMPLQYFPALSYVRVGGKNGEAYTVIYNKTYRSYKKDSITKQRSDEDMTGDTLAVLKGLAGAYPNFFFDLEVEEVEAFVAACENIQNEDDYKSMVERFGVRRTNPRFWKVADWFQEQHTKEQRALAKSLNQSVESGILDLSRYSDR
jgi:hypothetical protein